MTSLLPGENDWLRGERRHDRIGSGHGDDQRPPPRRRRSDPERIGERSAHWGTWADPLSLIDGLIDTLCTDAEDTIHEDAIGLRDCP